MIFEIAPFDYLTAPAGKMLGLAPLFAALPRLSPDYPGARLVIVTQKIDASSLLESFERIATPEEYLPVSVLAYRQAYQEHLRRSATSVWTIRPFLIVDTPYSDTVPSLLGSYGIRAWRLDSELPRPFEHGEDLWSVIRANGKYYALAVSRAEQAGAVIYPEVLHRLFALEIPLWVGIDVYTFSHHDAMRILHVKRAMAIYGSGDIAEANEVRKEIFRLQDGIMKGDALHSFKLYVLVEAGKQDELEARLQLVLSSTGLGMQRVYGGLGEIVGRVYSGEKIVRSPQDGTAALTMGVALLGGSALSYRQRIGNVGIMLGVDRGQSPVLVDIFSKQASSYNSVILGKTGSGKTFSALLLMMRHLLLGARLVIIDPQGNINLDFLEGSIYQRVILGTEGVSINVLDVVYDEIGPQVELAMALLRLLDVHQGGRLEKAILDEGLVELYRPVYEGKSESPLLSDLYVWLGRYRASIPGVRDTIELLRTALLPYISGSRARMFARTNIERITKAVNVFDVSRLPQQGIGSSLRAAMLTILIANINQGIRQLRSQGDRAPILFFVDEIGILLRDYVLAQYISAGFKTARSSLVGMIVADQDLHSLLGPQDERGLHHGIPILANAANVFLFRLEDQLNRVRDYFPEIPNSMASKLPYLTPGTCIASLEKTVTMLHFWANDLESALFSSRLEDRRTALQIIDSLRKELSVPYEEVRHEQ